MTQTEKIIALAELEGWTQKETSLSMLCFPGGYQKQNVTRWFRDGDVLCVNPVEELPPYLTSHDALQPLLAKMAEEEIMAYSNMLYFKFNYVLRDALKAKPEEKADLILKACGKWKE